MIKESREQEVSQNYETFQKQTPQLLQTHTGQFALMRHEQVVEFFDSIGDAVKYARVNYPDGLYSVQQVTQQIEDLGYFSHAVA